MEVEELDKYYNRTFWCNECNVPLLTERCYRCDSTGKHCASDLRPVFREERFFWNNEIVEFQENGFELPENLFYGRMRVVHNGQTLFSIDAGEGRLKLGANRFEELGDASDIQNVDRFQQRMFEANLPPIKELERSAKSFIQSTAKDHAARRNIISFSGGKDSTVVATLVKEALGDTPLFFADTTIELPDTYEYIERFPKENDFDLITEKSPNDFFEMCRKLEPPSHMMRWCCTVFKAYPVNKFLNSGKQKMLTFDGIRKAESSVRARYPRLHMNKKIVRQLVARPVFSWSTMAIWMYMLRKGLDFNNAYRKGYSRVGCYVCPFNSPYDDILTKHFYPGLSAEWEDLLIEFAKNHNKGWDLKWVTGGYWKQRKPHRTNFRIVSHRLCSETDTFRYFFRDRSITRDMLEFLKPFGSIEFRSPRFFRIRHGDSFELTGMLDGCSLKIRIEDDRHWKTTTRLDRQIEKSINCVSCGGCMGVCPSGAISVVGKFRVDESRCTHCLECVDTNFTSRGCVVLAFKDERGRIEKGQSAR